MRCRSHYRADHHREGDDHVPPHPAPSHEPSPLRHPGSPAAAPAADLPVVIAGLTVANGRTGGSPGAGTSVTGGTLTLDHVTVTGNYAVGTPDLYGYGGDAMGGGLYVAGGTVYVNRSTISGNTAEG